MEAGKALWEGFGRRQERQARFDELKDVIVLMSLPRISSVTEQNCLVDSKFTINKGPN
jgi:hypothetical protein